jgi:hypothetical protein
MVRIFELMSWREMNSSHRLMTLIVVMLGLLNFFFGEIVPAGGGFGWDGVVYANMTRNLFTMINEGQLNSYYAQRCLPSAIVGSLLRVANMPMSNANIIHAFELYNLVLLVGACSVWKRTSNHFSLSLGGRWLGFCGLFLSFQCSKQAFYYPVLTDVTAFFLGMLLLHFYVKKRTIALLVTTIIGAFAWQVVSICGAILLFFLMTDLPPEAIEPASSAPSYNSARLSRRMLGGWLLLVAGSILGLLSIICVERVLHLTRFVRYIGFLQRMVTGLPSLVAVIFALAILAGSSVFFKTVTTNLIKTKKQLILCAIAAFIIPWCIVRAISNPLLPNPSGLGVVARLMLMPPNGKILLALVTNVVFWGPLTILLLLKWNLFCVEVRKLGPGAVAVIGLALPLGLVTEPRFGTLSWPFFVLGAVLMLEKVVKGASFNYVFAALTVLYAQFWMKINLAPWSGGDFDGLLEFPKQVYFMHYGLWMSWWSFSLQLIVIGFSALWIRKAINLPSPHTI